MRLIKFVAFILLFQIPFLYSQPNGWSYKKNITIYNNTNSSTLTEYQIKVIFDHYGLVNSGKSRSDAGDIRFLDSDNSTNLSYWIESGINTSNCIVWIKVPQISANSIKTITLYYGNFSATSTSNGDATFLFFDHFDGSSYNSNKWQPFYQWGTYDRSGSVSVSNSELTVTSGANTTYGSMNLRFDALKSFAYNGGQRLKMKVKTPLWGGTGSSGQYRSVAYGLNCGDGGGVEVPGIAAFFWANESGLRAWIGVTGQSNNPSNDISSQYNPINYLTEEIQYLPSNSTNLYINGNLIQSYISNIPTTQVYPYFHVAKTGTYNQGQLGQIVCDWVFVAKCTISEPLLTIDNEIPTSGLIAYYPFNGNANDESGNGLNLNPIGSPSLTNDRFGNANKAYYFNGTTDYFYKSRSTLLLPTNAFTVSAWVYSDQIDGEEDVILSTYDPVDDNGGYQLNLYNQLVLFQVRTPNTENVTSSYNLIKSRWSHIVGVYDGITSKLFINGSMVASKNLSSTVKYSSTNNFRIGSNETPPGANRKLKGFIDDVRLYNRALSSSEVLALYNEPNPPYIPTIPGLSSPSNGLTNLQLNPTLYWSSVSNASSYRVQVSTSSSFSSLLYDQSGLTGTSFSLSGLTKNTTYYWRVNAGNSYGTSDWSGVWSFTTMNTPGAPLLNIPANGATGISTYPGISWNSATGATTYQLQVSTNSNFSVLAYNVNGLTSTSYSATGLSNNTIYYWHVRGNNAAGDGDWSNTWSFTTAESSPSIPLLSQPVNSASGISTSPIISWSAASAASAYDILLGTSADFSFGTVKVEERVTTIYKNVTGLSNNTMHYWKVRSVNTTGTSSWSSVWSFRTIEAIPGSLMLSSPQNSSIDQPINPTLIWNTALSATSYQLQVSLYSNFSSWVYNQSGLTATQQNITGLANNTKYYWRVCASSGAGAGAWSNTWEFTTITAKPSTVLLQSPMNNASYTSYDTPPKINLGWIQATNATSYNIQASANSNFSQIYFEKTGLTELIQEITTIAYNKYYWRVRAINSGGTGDWSEVWNFTILPPKPNPPTPNAPADGIAGVSLNPTLSWGVAPYASAYGLQVSDDINFGNPIFAQGNLSTNSQILNALKPNTIYYWRVRSENISGNSDWSIVRGFKTTDPTGIDNYENIKAFSLKQNYPNPFNPETRLEYSIPENTLVILKIYDVYGKEIETLINKNQSAGIYSVTWKPDNLPSGVYYYRLQAGKYSEMRKMVYVR